MTSLTPPNRGATSVRRETISEEDHLGISEDHIQHFCTSVIKIPRPRGKQKITAQKG